MAKTDFTALRVNIQPVNRVFDAVIGISRAVTFAHTRSGLVTLFLSTVLSHPLAIDERLGSRLPGTAAASALCDCASQR